VAAADAEVEQFGSVAKGDFASAVDAVSADSCPVGALVEGAVGTEVVVVDPETV